MGVQPSSAYVFPWPKTIRWKGKNSVSYCFVCLSQTTYVTIWGNFLKLNSVCILCTLVVEFLSCSYIVYVFCEKQLHFFFKEPFQKEMRSMASCFREGVARTSEWEEVLYVKGLCAHFPEMPQLSVNVICYFNSLQELCFALSHIKFVKIHN